MSRQALPREEKESMGTKTQDERYHVAEEAICDAFLLLLKEKPLDKLSVTDIIKKAGIARATFYNHFEDITALIAAMEDKTIRDIFSLMETFHPNNDRDICRSFFLTVCNYNMANPFLASLLKSPRGDAFFEKMLTMLHCYVKTVTQIRRLSDNDTEKYSYVIASAIGSTIGVLHKWTVDGFRIPPETIADILTQVFMAGMLPLMQP